MSYCASNERWTLLNIISNAIKRVEKYELSEINVKRLHHSLSSLKFNPLTDRINSDQSAIEIEKNFELGNNYIIS